MIDKYNLTPAQLAELRSLPQASEDGYYTKHRLPNRPLVAAALYRKGLVSLFEQESRPLHQARYVEKFYAKNALGKAVLDELDKQDISSYSHLIENESEGDHTA